MSAKYTIGLDYGTNSVRALIVNVANGAEVASAVWTYAHGTQGVILSRDPNLARQHPADYIKGAEITIKQALAAAKKSVKGFSASQVIGIGVDTTGSTPLPVDANGQPLAFQKKFANNPAAMAWLWKDHTGVNEAAEITALAPKDAPAISRQVRRHVFERMVLEQDSPVPPRRAGSFQRRPLLDRTGRLRSRRADRHGTSRANSSRAFAPPATRRCGMPNGAAIRTHNFFPSSIPSLASLRARLDNARTFD